LLSNTTQLSEHIQKFVWRNLVIPSSSGVSSSTVTGSAIRRTVSRGRLSRAILALYANQDPKDWEFPDKSVLTSVYYSLTDQPNLHHIFPPEFL